jgi:ubiquitin
VAAGTASELKARLERDVLEITVAQAERRDEAMAAIGAERAVAVSEQAIHLPVDRVDEGLAALRRIDDVGVSLSDFRFRRPTLDDVFIELTGRPAEVQDPETEATA